MGADGESSPYAGWRWVDYLVVGLFAALTVGIGKYFSSRNTSTESYYVGSRSLPAWAVSPLSLPSFIPSHIGLCRCARQAEGRHAASLGRWASPSWPP